MNSLLAKINPDVLMITQILEHARKATKPDYEVIEPKIYFKDGLPKDEAEQANIYAIRTGSNTISRKTALMKLDGLTEQQADKEMNRIEDEAKAEAELRAKYEGVRPSIFGNLNESPLA